MASQVYQTQKPEVGRAWWLRTSELFFIPPIPATAQRRSSNCGKQQSYKVNNSDEVFFIFFIFAIFFLVAPIVRRPQQDNSIRRATHPVSADCCITLSESRAPLNQTSLLSVVSAAQVDCRELRSFFAIVGIKIILFFEVGIKNKFKSPESGIPQDPSVHRRLIVKPPSVLFFQDSRIPRRSVVGSGSSSSPESLANPSSVSIFLSPKNPSSAHCRILIFSKVSP